jgi:D-hydroxyproline dehydrogenase subunit alpha
MTLHCEVAVVGGGPAGLTAGALLARAGLRVAVIEERNDLGGQYFKQRHGGVLQKYGSFRPAGASLIAAAIDAGVACLTGHLAWGFQDGELWISRHADGRIERVQAASILLATGAYEKANPFPGWTLPGVCTPGCALHFAVIDKVNIGRRVVVAGSGPFLLSVASSLLNAGMSVTAVLEAGFPYRLSKTSLRAMRYIRRVREMTTYLVTLRQHGVPIRQGWRVLEATGGQRVRQVKIGRAAHTEELDVDTLCVGYGFSPNSELAQLIGVECKADPVSGDIFPIADDYGRTSKPNVYVAGEIAGIEGVQSALNLGRLAAIAIAEDLGIPSQTSAHSLKQLLKARRALKTFAAISSSLYHIDSSPRPLPDQTIVCRCESVTAESIRKAAFDSDNDLQAVKGLTRAGMGPCQGRECGSTVAAIAGADLSAAGRFSSRMPTKPILIGPELDVDPTIHAH